MLGALPTLPAPGACNSNACNAAMVVECGIGESDEVWHCRWVYTEGYVCMMLSAVVLFLNVEGILVVRF